MSKPRLLDLFCCEGGAGMGYHRAGFDVVGVDINPQPAYPFEFHQADALEFIKAHGHEFDAVHASPPCQAHTTLTKGNRGRARRVGQDHVDLIAATRDALDAAGLPYVIENVQAAPVRPDVVLCGLMFDLRVFRHRLFELGRWTATAPAHPTHRGHRVAGWRHGVRYDGDMVAVYGDGGGKGSIETWQAALGIDWTSNRRSLAEAIPPAFTEWVGAQLLAELQSGASTRRDSSPARTPGSVASPGRRTGSLPRKGAPSGSASSARSHQSESAAIAACSPASNRGRDVLA